MQRHYLIFVVLLYAFATLGTAFTLGLHPDSLVYMSMARNLAEGMGTFWQPHFSSLIFDQFYEHPPLGIAIMALPFALLGDTLVIDKLFGFFVGLVIVALILSIWRLLMPQNREGGWLAIFYFLIFPVTSYGLQNNLLEPIATPFILGAVWAALRALVEPRLIYIYAGVFSACLIGGFLVKGPVTVFPLAVPLLYVLMYRSATRPAVVLMLLTVALLSITALALYAYDPAARYLGNYFTNQLYSSLSGSRGGDDRSSLTIQLLLHLSLAVVVSMLIMMMARIKFRVLHVDRIFLLCLLIALSGSLPLEMSPRQSDFYLFPALPFLALALAALFRDVLNELLTRQRRFHPIYFLNSLLAAGLIVLFLLQPQQIIRHRDYHEDFTIPQIPITQRSTIHACSSTPEDNYEFFANTEIPGNLQRYYGANIVKDREAPYWLTTKASLAGCAPDDTYSYIGREDPAYFLIYRKQNRD